MELPRFLKMQQATTLNFLTGESSGALEIKLARATEADKLDSLFRLICHLGNRSTIVFLNHRDAVQRTSEYLKDKGLVNVFYHGALEQPERDAALCKFRNGTSNILVTTDLAARGLDIPHIRYIIHYHLPLSEESFIHRNGRTARMEASGTAILLMGPSEDIPDYIAPDSGWVDIPDTVQVPDKPQWVTLHIAGGKKNKINKIDIVGFLAQQGELKKEDIGLIEVKDFFSFVAIRKSKMSRTLPLIEKQKIKGQRVKIEIAK
jgi:ATP-independent RNA helicase DbpA